MIKIRIHDISFTKSFGSKFEIIPLMVIYLDNSRIF